MPKKILNIARSASVKPVTVKLVQPDDGALLDLSQDLELVPMETQSKTVDLLYCIQMTPPPVLMFAERDEDVDAINQYLRFKRIRTAALHDGLDQDKRSKALQAYSWGDASVLVATDSASKGLDWSNIYHVINIKHVMNYDMSEDIGDYVNRVGRVDVEELSTLLGKAAEVNSLRVVGEKITFCSHLAFLPDVFSDPGIQTHNIQDCSYCGGHDHKITECLKLSSVQDLGCREYVVECDMGF